MHVRLRSPLRHNGRLPYTHPHSTGTILRFASLPIMPSSFLRSHLIPPSGVINPAHRWYRAPELLFGARWYGLSMDLWAVGAIFGELCTLCPLFPGRSDMDQVFRVLQVMGTATHESWPVRTPPLITRRDRVDDALYAAFSRAPHRCPRLSFVRVLAEVCVFCVFVYCRVPRTCRTSPRSLSPTCPRSTWRPPSPPSRLPPCRCCDACSCSSRAGGSRPPRSVVKYKSSI